MRMEVSIVFCSSDKREISIGAGTTSGTLHGLSKMVYWYSLSLSLSLSLAISLSLWLSLTLSDSLWLSLALQEGHAPCSRCGRLQAAAHAAAGQHRQPANRHGLS